MLYVKLFMSLFSVVTTFGSRASADFMNYSLVDSTTGQTVLPGQIYVPPESTNGPRPLILFMHGAGESGTNNQSQINSNITNLYIEAQRRGAFLYAPQTATNWSNMQVTNRVMTMINRSLTDFSIASDRVYVTGLSMGGGGAWNMLNRYGDSFAAGVVIAGVPPANDFVPSNLFDEPTWAFHARNDSVVDVSSSRNTLNSILTANGESTPMYPNSGNGDFNFQSISLDLRYTEFQFGGHGIWNQVYSTPEVYDWMFSKTTAVPEPSALTYVLAVSVIVVGMLFVPTFRRWQQTAY